MGNRYCPAAGLGRQYYGAPIPLEESVKVRLLLVQLSTDSSDFSNLLIPVGPKSGCVRTMPRMRSLQCSADTSLSASARP